MKKFLRRNWSKASRLGRGRKSKQVWRSAKGRHSKTRGKRKGYPAIVEIGFKRSESKEKPVMIQNVKDLGKVVKGETAIVGKIGNKKKLEIAKKAKEKEISILNLNINKVLKKSEKKQKTKEEKKK